MQVRKATLADYDDVMALDPDNTIYSGNDYIPATYKQYINDPDRQLLVGILDGKTVAFCMWTYIDNGATSVGMAARVHARLQGSGLWRQFGDIATEFLKSGINFASTQSVKEWHHLSKFKSLSQYFSVPHLLEVRYAQIHQFNPEPNTSTPSALSATWQQQATITRLLTDTESMAFLDNRDVQWQLFPNRRILCNVGLIPYRLMTSNFKTIVHDMHSIAATLVTSDDVTKQASPLSMSFANGLPVHNGYQTSVHYYAADAADGDVSDLVRHVMLHLHVAARRHTKQPLQLRILFSPRILASELGEALRMRVPGYECAVDSFRVAVLERSVDQSKPVRSTQTRRNAAKL